MSLQFKEQRGGTEPDLVTVVIANSEVITIGDAVKIRTGFAVRGTAGAAIGGVVIDLVDASGNSVFGSLGVLGAATKSGTPAVGSGTVTVASNNQTVDKIAARLNLSLQAVYSATVTGTMNTTATSATQGGWVDMDDEDSVDETTHTRTITTGGQLRNWGQDPDETTRILVSINESEVYSAADPLAA